MTRFWTGVTRVQGVPLLVDLDSPSTVKTIGVRGSEGCQRGCTLGIDGSPRERRIPPEFSFHCVKSRG